MFLTLISQYLNKLVESKVGDFTSPKPFHTIKVQGFKNNGIKSLAQIIRQFPLKIKTLVADFSIKTCESSDATPPAIRPFLFTTQRFGERPKFLQRLFQRLRLSYLLTRAQWSNMRLSYRSLPQHSYPLLAAQFGILKIGCETKPIITTSVAFDCDTTDIPFKLTLLVKCIWHSIKMPLTCPRVPFTECQRNAVVLQRPPRRSGICYRLEFVFRFPFRLTAKFIKETLICHINTSQFLLYRLRRQSLPMRMSGSLQLSKVCSHRRIVGIRQSVFIPLILPLMEIVMHLPHIVKQIAKTYRIRLTAKLIFIGFQWTIKYQVFNPFRVGRQTRCRETTLDMSVNLIL